MFSLQVILYVCLDETLVKMFKKQITSLDITMAVNEKRTSMKETTSLFTNVLTVYTNLRYLNCRSSSYDTFYGSLFFDVTPTFSSSTIIELHVYVSGFSDCLYLLDGRFNQLRTFYVNIRFIPPISQLMINKVSYFMRTIISLNNYLIH
jgi:hypothetical protein